ncbi:hypothetical protein JAAARDRAFT_36597 [Jaapia argillacea MUCL 33604]|uniref:TOG domain-containing protein n=1 Tax=Jaapia argillacea MUCL 33604 TaxID=933084 RepID=A0A067PRJ9_9AGAM|nr:hypothetical protein JAAARDRAFT_36597 [Jaapia argillacea MUCL 33604]
MGRSDIESWIAGASTSAENSLDQDPGFVAFWKADRSPSQWPQALDLARSKLLSASTRVRTAFLREELYPVVRREDLNLSQTLDIFKLLTQTYPRYVDTASRDAVEVIGMEMIRRDELRGTDKGPPDESKLGVTEQILGWLHNEVNRISKKGTSSSYAAADIFVLSSWSCGIYTVCLENNPDFTTSRAWDILVGVMAVLLDIILGPSTHAKSSLKHGALVRTRRALRSAPTRLPVLMSTIVRLSKTNSTPPALVPLLGVAVDVTIRLKNVKDENLLRVTPDLKTGVINLYTTNVLMVKSPVATHISTALNDFIRTSLTSDDLTKTVLPTMEKALLRSPEYSLDVIREFFTAYSHPLADDTFQRILTSTLNSVKSSNPLVRTNAINLFKIIMEKNASDQNVTLAVNDLLVLPKTGKSSGPDHRVALFTMLGYIVPSESASSLMVQNVPALIVKETHDAAVSVLAPSLAPHLVFYLRANRALSSEVTTLIATQMNSSKPMIRRAFCSMTGNVFWDLGNDFGSEASLAFAKSILPSFETNLKTVAANPLGAVAGPLEGYVAVAIILGPFARSGKFEEFITRNPVIKSLASVSPKPSFLLWDKVYQKLISAEDETWFLRALEVATSNLQKELVKDETLRQATGPALLHLAIESQSSEIRRITLSALETLSAQLPDVVVHTVREGLLVYLTNLDKVPGKGPVIHDEDEKPSVNKEGRLASFLLASVAFKEDADLALKETLVAELIVVSHHPRICGKSRQVWIEICQKARVDPMELVNHTMDKLLKLIEAANSLGHGLTEAGYRAVTTLTFVSPTTVLPRVMEQLRTCINPSEINSLSDTDLGIWQTPPDQTFIDVLSSKQSSNVDKKGKDADIAKWEAEVRKTLANKKTVTSAAVSKQDQALVQAQLQKEAEIRRRVNTIQNRLGRGLHLVHSLVSARVDEFRSYISSVATLLLDGAFDKAVSLVGTSSFDAYIALASCCSDRLDIMRKWIGVATLRSLRVKGIPEEIQAEPLNLLVIRVLYRLRSLSEQSPLDSSTFAYSFHLLGQILIKGALELSEEDDPLEQIVLSLDIVKFHAGEFSDSAFPRKSTMDALIQVMQQQPRLAKDASSALVDIGQAIFPTVAEDELSVLLRGTLQQEVFVRNACLQALQPFDLTDLDWSPELWVAIHDDDEQNSRLAQNVWEENGLDVPSTYLPPLQAFLEHQNAYVRSGTARALAEAVEHWPQSIGPTGSSLQEFYRDKAKILAPEFDQYGMVIEQSLNRTDPWPTRLAISQAFEYAAPYFTENEVVPFFSFLIKDEALGDSSPEVRRGMLNAGIAVLDLHGATRLAALIAMFEDQLATAGRSETADYIKEAVVILFGRIARHLDPTDPRLPSVVSRLVDALKTPSEQVQSAVADCLGPLVAVMTTPVNELVDQLFDQLFNSPKYAARRGAAYGLAGVVKGAGIPAMKEFDILNRLQVAAADKKKFEQRQGVLFALETFTNMLGRVFEPYITHVLPLLLASFGDSSADVREATQDAARVIMANMSGYGVKLILPTLLSGLDEKQWRTKKGSIELLGMMAYCAPRQLSQSLPIVIPRLTGVLTDSHAQVRAAANTSLKQFGEVISNPEIQSLVPTLLKALVDPGKTPNALSSLLKTSFVHYIDQSSLALVVPIIERGLRERGADTKKKAAQIVGNLASLTDSRDFVPYLSELLPMVHMVLVDPVPEARATAAKALGTLVERLGEIHFPDLVPGLLRTLKTDTSGVDRQGAAQGLSEVLAGLGMERLEGLLPDIIANAQSPRSTVREGFMTLLVFLPATFGTRFQPHLPKIITPILSGLADTEEYVREASMRAGRMVITNYANKAIDLLLPELERGMFDPGWRIRQSSITLVGELLFKVSGISGKAEIEEEEEVEEIGATESSRRALTEVLGAERRDRILSALYLARQDAVALVRQSSIHIWKALVHNTPRTVREILPELFGQIVTLLSSSEFEQQETAARTTGELCRKSGEKMLAEIVGILRAKSTSPDPRTREGVCLAISELLPNTGDAQREGHEDEIISMVRVSLVDDESNVRSAAARAFDVLQEHLGAKAIDQTIPTLLEALRQPGASSDTALHALTEVMSVRASTVFPVLIPTLTASPMSVFNARALASLVTVAGNALSKRLTVILNALVKEWESEPEEELRSAIDEALRALFGAISDAEGLNTLMLLLLGWARHDSVNRRVTACEFFAIFSEVSELDSSLYRIDWIRTLVSLLDDRQKLVHTASWRSLDTFIKTLPKDELEPLVVPLRRTIEGTGALGHVVPGFSLPKGVSPIVPIVIAGLTTGSNEQREQAAYAIGDLVERTSEEAIKPFVVPFTGPLIRVATQATTYPPAVKTAILSALTTMLERIPAFVKPFFPQLQRTFVKSTSDPSSLVVRNRAAQALGVLMKNQPRVDPVVTELLAGARTSEDAIAASLVGALAGVMRSGGDNVGAKAKEGCVELIEDAFKESHEEPYVQAVAQLFAALSPYPDLLKRTIESHLLPGTPPTVLSSHSILAILSSSQDDTSNIFQTLSLIRPIAQRVLESIGSDKPSIARPARESRDLLKGLEDDSLVGLF